MDEKHVYLESLNAYNHRHGIENPKIISTERHTPKGLHSIPCFKVIYESDGKIDYIACSELMEHNWRFI